MTKQKNFKKAKFAGDEGKNNKGSFNSKKPWKKNKGSHEKHSNNSKSFEDRSKHSAGQKSKFTGGNVKGNSGEKKVFVDKSKFKAEAKKAKIIEEEEAEDCNVNTKESTPVKLSLAKNSEEIQEANEKFQKELSALFKKYAAIRNPLYEKRREDIQKVLYNAIINTF
ncbi:MAG: hypothetical protein ACRCSC_00650 [Lactococcus garvieae]